MTTEAVKLTELVAVPARGRIFTEPPVRPGLADCAPTGRVRLDALARFVQDIAYADAEDAHLSRRAAWVVRRTRMRVDRFPRFGERLELATFCSALGRMWAERRTTIAGDAGGAAHVVSLWVHLDPLSGRPIPLTEEEIAMWGESTLGRRVTARLHHPSPEGAEDSLPWRFRATECDMAAHINNAAYLQPLEDELLNGGGGELESIDVEIEYRSPAQPGDMLVLRDGARRWITNPGGEVHASLIVASLNHE
ncbi:MAG TPA: acyl-ACP thioesterase domain-containing protein [Solirubrobacteraceae bacterium]|nr:acyl-ACP thioesterase domain-containing protein [Solirubrobacteraceae bacterium]